MYAWIIDNDHLAVAELAMTGRCEDDARGTTGPRGAPEWMREALLFGAQCDVAASVFRFQMRDDDGELYYTGRLMTDVEDDEEAAYAPLGNFGMPNAGCTSITYPGHSELDCG